ncbi:MAG TPA: BamA/TamA family outer membrane protein, partial [Candidatus Eisenbacteria bacterium]|nr:BamA/TamA family outer membrane protein [Candidatus Eisenbacteria bacterium]
MESHWGYLPAGSDTVCVPLADRPKALWERALLAPYRVVTFPISMVTHGVGAGVGYVDEHRVLDRVARLLGPRQGPFGLLVDFRFGGLSGLGGGLTAEHTRFFGEGNTFRARASTTDNGDHRLGLAARFGGARRSFLEFGAGYRQRPNVRYFGIGPDTKEEDESFLHQEAAWAGLARRWALGAQSHLEANALYSSVATGAPGEGNDPPAEDRFASSLPAAYGRHSYGASVGGQWGHESPGLENRPGRGGIRRLRATYFDGVDRDDVRFWTFRGEAQQFFTLWRPQRVLALRGVASWIEDVGNDPVPAARLNTNDDPDLLRGYDDFRWRDRGIAILTAEYRWPLWTHKQIQGTGIDAYLLTDAGQVFGDADELALDRMTLS